MNASLIILRVVSLGHDAQNERDGAGAAQLRRSSNSVAVALQPSTRMTVVSASRPSSRCCWQHLEEGRGGISTRDTSCCCRAASAPSQQHQLLRSNSTQQHATAVSHDDERSTGAFLYLNLFQHSLDGFTRSVISPTLQPMHIRIRGLSRGSRRRTCQRLWRRLPRTAGLDARHKLLYRLYFFEFRRGLLLAVTADVLLAIRVEPSLPHDVDVARLVLGQRGWLAHIYSYCSCGGSSI